MRYTHRSLSTHSSLAGQLPAPSLRRTRGAMAMLRSVPSPKAQLPTRATPAHRCGRPCNSLESLKSPRAECPQSFALFTAEWPRSLRDPTHLKSPMTKSPQYFALFMAEWPRSLRDPTHAKTECARSLCDPIHFQNDPTRSLCNLKDPGFYYNTNKRWDALFLVL